MAGYDDDVDRRDENRNERDDYDDRRDRKRDLEEARQKVQLPATLLLVSGIFYILGALGYLAYIIISINIAGEQLENDPRFRNPGAGGQDVKNLLLMGVAVWSVEVLIACVLGVLIIIGALKMRNLKSRGLSITACILGMIPCSVCCILSLPMGIWGLVTLNSPEVKDSFR